MKKIIISLLSLLVMVQGITQNNDQIPNTVEPLGLEPIGGIIFPIVFISFLVFMIISLVKYFLEYRLKNKLIDRGTPELLSVYLSSKNDQEKQNEVIKLAILFCGIGIGLIAIYWTAPINIHSLAIMAFSLGLSHFAYFFYLRK